MLDDGRREDNARQLELEQYSILGVWRLSSGDARSSLNLGAWRDTFLHVGIF
jgi:hypothetical protein